MWPNIKINVMTYDIIAVHNGMVLSMYLEVCEIFLLPLKKIFMGSYFSCKRHYKMLRSLRYKYIERQSLKIKDNWSFYS